MSLGRQPFYIIESFGEDLKPVFTVYHPENPPINIPYEAVAQLVASMAWRENEDLQHLVSLGVQLRKNDWQDLEDIEVTVKRVQKNE